MGGRSDLEVLNYFQATLTGLHPWVLRLSKISLKNLLKLGCLYKFQPIQITPGTNQTSVSPLQGFAYSIFPSIAFPKLQFRPTQVPEGLAKSV